MTVRDYAKHRVKSVVCKYMLPKEIKINILKDNEIKEILKDNFEIYNEIYLDKIVKIAKGNIRLAILAGKIAIDEGYLAISNATDIFAMYYGKIIETAVLNEDAVKTLFTVAFLGAFRYKESDIAQKLLDLLNVDFNDFITLCRALHEKELIDLYADEVVKVSDQSLGNYIIKYILIEKKIISISQLLHIGFPHYKNKILYALNTLIQLFYSEDMMKYIIEQVDISWDKADKRQQEEYLKCFHSMNKEKSLSILKEKIDGAMCIAMDISQFDIENNKNNINCTEIDILCSFKYSEYYEDAIELLMVYYKKRPDMIMDFYVAFSDRLSFDEYSFDLDCEKEYKLVDCLWKYANGGKNINVTILLLHVFKELLKCDFHKAESGENNRSIIIHNIMVKLTDGSKKLRFHIWKILSEIYFKNNYINLINDIISCNYTGGLESEDAKLIQSYDLQCIKNLFFNKLDDLSFEQCQVLRELEKHAEWLGIETAAFLNRYTENEDFVIYNTLVKEHIKGNTLEEDKNAREIQIKGMIKDYNSNDYEHLFNLCRIFEEKNDENGWMLRSGIGIVFELLEFNTKVYLNTLEIYLKCNAPYGNSPYRIICQSITKFGIAQTNNIIEKYEFSYKHYWKRAIFENTPKEMINEKYIIELLRFIKQETALEEPALPSVLCLKQYRDYDAQIVKKVAEIIIKYPPKQNFVANFLDNFYDEETIDLILDLFNNEWELLGKLYLIAMGSFFDNGKLLVEIVKRNKSFWNDFTKKIRDNMYRASYEHNVFEEIWSMDNYRELIQIAYENMIDNNFGYINANGGIDIFADDKKTPIFISQRKKQWIKEYIKNNIENIDNLKTIFDVISSCLASDRVEYITELLRNTNDIKLFRSISLFAKCESWWGSEVPIIEKKIGFVDELIKNIKGVDFIDHRAYLKEMKNSLERYKQEVLIREYLEENDIA